MFGDFIDTIFEGAELFPHYLTEELKVEVRYSRVIVGAIRYYEE